MNLEKTRQKARDRLKGICRVCKTCDGEHCIGTMPGMGGRGTGTGFKNNFAALSRVLLNMRTIHGVANPDLTYELFDCKLSFPILGAPMCETTYNYLARIDDHEFIVSQVSGANQAGTLAMIGDSPQAGLYEMGLEAIRKAGNPGIAVIKPRRTAEIIELIRCAETAGALAVAIDIDAAAFPKFALAGQTVGPKTREQICEIVEATKLPVILKGIMTVGDALEAVEANVAGIIVSNHGGRSLDYTPGTADVLPEIAGAVKGKTRILMDGGIRSGEDVLKALALGAEAVLIGRPIAIAAIGGKAEGVKLQFAEMAEQLKTAMILTGCSNLDKIGSHAIRTACDR